MLRYLLPLLLWSAAALAQAPAVSIENAWARATPGAATTGAVYLTIVDRGGPDRLVGASTPVAAAAELHESRMDGGIMTMRAIEGGLPVMAGMPVQLVPGGAHLMLMGLKRPLQTGQSFPLTLTFENSGTVQTTVSVMALGAAAPMSMDHATPKP